MVIEHAGTDVVRKPWGSTDLKPWSEVGHDGGAIGEIWFQRHDRHEPDPTLLLKLLFTNEQLSIQVHPDDVFAQSLGLAQGKSEAWYILSAAPDARIAVGLKRQLSAPELRDAIADGSIADLVAWRRVMKGDFISVPAGTIHSIGPGLVIAEIQQRSDATFRLFDHGRKRELHVDNGVAAARAGPADSESVMQRLTDARTVLVADPHFVLERIDLSPGSDWDLHVEHETWFLVLDGEARIGNMHAKIGDAFFAEAALVDIEVGAGGLKGLLTYVGREVDLGLLRLREERKPALAMRRASSWLPTDTAMDGAFSAMEARQ